MRKFRVSDVCSEQLLIPAALCRTDGENGDAGEVERRGGERDECEAEGVRCPVLALLSRPKAVLRDRDRFRYTGREKHRQRQRHTRTCTGRSSY